MGRETRGRRRGRHLAFRLPRRRGRRPREHHQSDGAVARGVMFAGALAKLAKPGPRKLLSLDGGGIRGLITIEILAQIERVVRGQSGKRSLVLADYFDYIAGTSTGAVIGTLLALGKPVEEIRGIYLDCGRMMFDRNTIERRLENLGKKWPFAKQALMAAELLGYYLKRWAGK